MNRSRRSFLTSLSATALVLTFDDILALAAPQSTMQRPTYNATPHAAPKQLPSPVLGTPLGVSFIDVARQSGLNARTIYGGEHHNKYLLETTGCGVAFYDYDHDDWLDIFLVNGFRLEGFPKGHEPTCHLFKNNRDGTFTDVTQKAGLARSGWGQGCCIGDYNNDGYDDLFVSYYGQNALYRNNGNGTFTDVTKEAGLLQSTKRWNSGCAFLDYDRDGHLDLFVANYIDFDIKTAPIPSAAGCEYKGIQVACGPPGLQGGKNILYHNNGDGTFTDVSAKSGILDTIGTYGLSVAVCDFDNDGWPDIYVANDSMPATLYQNQHNGTFKDNAIEDGVAYSPDGKPQAGMGVSVGDYNRDGFFDIVKTNFAGDTDSLYLNLGDGTFDDRTYQSGLGVNTRFLGWGCGFFDMDNDGWPDILIANGHVYPEVDGTQVDAPYAEHKYLYRNLRNGQFEDVSAKGGPGIMELVPARGCAFGDYDNDGDIDIVVNCINHTPQLLRCDSTTGRNWIKIRTVGTKSNRTGIGARITVTTQTSPTAKPFAQIDEVRSGGSYYSQNDLRIHFGLDRATKADIEITWPSGTKDKLPNLTANRLYVIEEGGKILKTMPMGKP
ncbi:RNA-binding protein [Edaphobacter acidisoli]|uniref:RNA-binding protein n=1 Tax=Edaphobacter acidisoli TaxID=2040573 RepID=A0A916W7G0_9BACT|nr:CRTAC1 family protein [Edaphobacter acidisoli]GGA72384.1 RNA-binding protein [Edaphobacter acidisoli]